jgi:hypothetical protein
MTMLWKKVFVITILTTSLGLLLGVANTSTYAAQTKTKKNTKAENAEIAANNPIDLNTASEQELGDLPGVGPALAKRIIASRPYSSTSELSRAGIPAKTIKKITPMVTVGSGRATGENKAVPSANTTSAATAATSGAPASPAPSSKSESKAMPAAPAGGGGNGKVWVNTKSGVYHRQGDKWYGKTKEGKYMTEDEAIKAGFRADKEKQSGKKND